MRSIQQLGDGASRYASFAPYMLAALLLLLPGPSKGAFAFDRQPFVGSYVGKATAEDLATGERQERDLDSMVMPHGEDGLRIEWNTVGLVDGQRDVPGVKRWSQTVLFEPSAKMDFMLEVNEGSVFEEREELTPQDGDPVRWTRANDKTLYTMSFMILEDGRYELQVYRRVLTDIGMDIHFESIVDGDVIRRVVGKTVRAE